MTRSSKPERKLGRTITGITIAGRPYGVHDYYLSGAVAGPHHTLLTHAKAKPTKPGPLDDLLALVVMGFLTLSGIVTGWALFVS